MKYVLKADAVPPRGWVKMHIPGAKEAWVDPVFAVKLGELCAFGKKAEAKVLMIWMGGEEEAA